MSTGTHAVTYTCTDIHTIAHACVGTHKSHRAITAYTHNHTYVHVFFMMNPHNQTQWEHTTTQS